MADQNNPGQFGNRNDTEKQAQKGGEASTGSFGEKNAADPSKAGQEGAEAQPTEAKREGGEHGAAAQPTEAKREGGRNSGQGS